MVNSMSHLSEGVLRFVRSYRSEKPVHMQHEEYCVQREEAIICFASLQYPAYFGSAAE